MDDIRGAKVPWGTTFNGIINLSIQENKQLMCYAFIFSTDTKNQQNNTPQRQIEMDFNMYNIYGDSGAYEEYRRAYIHQNYLSGSTDAPVLESGIIDLSERENYKLLLTGYDVPYVNKGEAAGLFYEGVPVEDSYYGQNCTNFAVIYKLNISNFLGSKMILEMNPYTNIGYFADEFAGIFVVAFVANSNKRTLELIDIKKPSTTIPDISSDCQIYILVSGMSTLPVTLKFN